MSSKAVVINANQMCLWNEVIPTVNNRLASLVGGVSRVDEESNELVSQTLRVLPVKAGEGKDSLSRRNPDADAAKLKELAKAGSNSMKEFLTQSAVKLGQNPDMGGLAIRVSKRGQISLVYKRTAPQVAFKTDEEYALELGCSVDEVKQIRKNLANQPKVIDVGAASESQPTQPKAKARAKTVKAPEAKSPTA